MSLGDYDCGNGGKSRCGPPGEITQYELLQYKRSDVVLFLASISSACRSRPLLIEVALTYRGDH